MTALGYPLLPLAELHFDQCFLSLNFQSCFNRSLLLSFICSPIIPQVGIKCLHHFSVCCSRSTLKRKEFVLAHSLGVRSITAGRWGSESNPGCCSRSVKWLITLCPQSGREINCPVHVFSGLFSLKLQLMECCCLQPGGLPTLVKRPRNALTDTLRGLTPR